MRTVEINLLKYYELSEQAKNKVKENWEFEDFWQGERTKSYEAAKNLLKVFDIDTEISGARLYSFIQNNFLPRLRERIKYSKTETGKHYQKYPSSKIYEKEKARFSKIEYSEDAINLTGYCADYIFLDHVFEFLKNPDKKTTNFDLLNENLEYLWEKDVQNEYEAFYEEQNFAEHMESNGYEFTEDGELY